MANERAVVGFQVDDLFGTRSYRVSATADRGALSRLLILYGDNGSGKTTLLRLLYALLSTARNRGDKTFLARVPFRRVALELANGTIISATRPADARAGNYILALEKVSGFGKQVQIVVSPGGDIDATPELSAQLDDLYEQIRSIGLALYYVSDTRELRSSVLDAQAGDDPDMNDLLSSSVRREFMARRRAARESRDERLEAAVGAMEQWARQQALRRSSVGDENANTIYSDVVQRIAALPHTSEVLSGVSADALKEMLRDLSVRSASFSEFGLVPRFESADLVAAIDRSPSAALPILASVLDPHLDGIRVRLDAMQELRDVLSTFVGNLNALYSHKTVSFNVRRGLGIATDDRRSLPPTALSSGERQLLLLLCNTLVARDQPTIFIIDEPEISLNVKWQRRLVPTLLDSVAGSEVQFILATHSIEVLAKQQRHVVPLSMSSDE